MELILLKIGSNEWENAWEWVANHPINEGYDEPSLVPNKGAGWQYIGTFKNKDGRAISEFRHRNHPRFQRREYIKFAHEKEIAECDIEKVIPIK